MMLTPQIMKSLRDKGYTDEDINFIEDNVYKELRRCNGYRILTGRKVTVIRNIHNDKAFYKIPIKHVRYDGREETAYRTVQFANCKPPQEDQTQIIITKFFEDFYFKNNDRYTPIFTLVIQGYYFVDEEKRKEYEAIGKYNKELFSAKNDKEHFSLNDQWEDVQEDF